MARTKKGDNIATKKNAGRGKDNKTQVIPDAHIDINDNIEIDIYERENRDDTCKITLCGAFVIYGRIIQSDKGAFISYPSFKNSKGDYINQAFCFDKDIIAQINAELENLGY